MTDITQILAKVESGEQGAVQELLSAVYDELRRLASVKMSREVDDHMLQATALVHEAFLRLVGSEETVSWQNRRHFFGAAAEAMRRVLVDAARRRNRLKRGSEHERTFIDLAELPQFQAGQDLEEVDAALNRFADGRSAESGGGEAAIFCRIDDRTDGKSAGHFDGNRRTSLDLRTSLVVSRTLQER